MEPQKYNGQKKGYALNPSTSDYFPIMKHSNFYGNWLWFENYKDARSYSNKIFSDLYPNGRIIIADKF